ncbi:MAG TPA: hypothetical protein VGR78_01135 [Verrucomicrobiae bacterium]|nr:hypothetical protein [Verrucomicrobiae bacterium]
MGWAEKLKNVVHSAKDTGAAAAIRAWLAREMADYGELLDFKLNSREKRAELHVLLKGESLPLTVMIEDYELTNANGADFIVVKRAQASREWVNAVLRNFLIGKRHLIPAQFSGMVKLVLNT